MSEVPLQVGLDARPGHEGALLSSVLTPLGASTLWTAEVHPGHY